MTAETQTLLDAVKPKWKEGPWEVLGDLMIAAHQDIVVDQIRGLHACSTLDRASANAHLIAASPDLYEALWNMAIMAEPFMTDEPQRLAFDLARRALARARGEVS